MSRKVLAAVIVSLVALSRRAHAEGPTLSLSEWRFDGARVAVRTWVPVTMVARIGGSAADVERKEGESLAPAGWVMGERLSRGLVLSAGAHPCEVEGGGPSAGDVNGDWVEHSWSLRCPEGETLSLRVDALVEDTPSHVHLARIWRARTTAMARADDSRGSAIPLEHAFSAADRSWSIGPTAGPPRRWMTGGIELASHSARGAPLLLTFLGALGAATWRSDRAVRSALVAAAGLACGGLAAALGRVEVSIPMAALAVLAIALEPFIRDPNSRPFAFAIGTSAIVWAWVRQAAALGPFDAAGLVPIGLGLTAAIAWRAPRFGVAIEWLSGLMVAATLSLATHVRHLTDAVADGSSAGEPMVALSAFAWPALAMAGIAWTWGHVTESAKRHEAEFEREGPSEGCDRSGFPTTRPADRGPMLVVPATAVALSIAWLLG